MKEVARSFIKELTIRSLGVIESAHLELDPGLNVITGETGAGKTMIFTALSLLTGVKSDPNLIRIGEDRLVVSALISLPDNLLEQVREIGGEIQGNEVLLSRLINSNGKSKATLGGVPITLSFLTDFTSQIIEIHSQASHYRFEKEYTQRNLLDQFATLTDQKFVRIKEEYDKAIVENLNLRSRIKSLQNQSNNVEEEIQRLETLVKECDKVQPQEDEWNDVNEEITRLDSIESIAARLSCFLNEMENDEGGVISALNRAGKELVQASDNDSTLGDYPDRFLDVQENLKDLTRELLRYQNSLEADPVRFSFLQDRKAILQALIKKYGKEEDRNLSLNYLISDWKNSKDSLADLRGGRERIEHLQNEIQKNEKEIWSIGLELMELRKNAAQKLETRCEIEFENLALQNGKVQFLIEPESEQGKFTSEGIEHISFLYRSFSDGKFLPISKVASGGELSRIFLALEVALAQYSSISIYLFDEVDAGIGGKTGLAVGKLCANLARSYQVFLVTHLPQVAIWGDRNFLVEKNDSGSIAASGAKEISRDALVSEIARLLAGERDSASAKEHSRELLENARFQKREMSNTSEI